ncbi:hypothetical protein L7F22_001541 [Adiantum nelumboides]|nr:hypothetical protein [Adiantum nelumboides]
MASRSQHRILKAACFSLLSQMNQDDVKRLCNTNYPPWLSFTTFERKQLAEKQMRWANILSQFHFQIVHVQGQKNVVADALSRKPLVQAISAIHHSTFEDMIDQYATHLDFADIFTRIRDGKTVAGYSLREGYLMRKTTLCVTQPLREKVMTECHCPPYTGHRGIATTMKGVERYFYWPRLKKDVEEFVRSCLVCQKIKFDRHKAQGLLQPLPIPTRPWESIAMDFIFDLPRTQSGHDGIWTIIDRFSKQAHFVSVKKTVKPDNLARLCDSDLQITWHARDYCLRQRSQIYEFVLEGNLREHWHAVVVLVLVPPAD